MLSEFAELEQSYTEWIPVRLETTCMYLGPRECGSFLSA